MTYERRKRSESDIYHLIARGVGRHLLFEDDADRKRYVNLFTTHFDKQGVSILAWCLMDNHVHLIASGDLDKISTAMQFIGRSYAHYFNARHDRVGHLMQGRFKSVPISSDEQLLETVRYVHLNPERAGIEKASSYKWSSYREYQSAPEYVDPQLVLEMLGGPEAFEEFHLQESENKSLSTRSVTERMVSTDAAVEVLDDVLSRNGLTEVPVDDRKVRDSLIRELRNRGLSVRQIERLTGIGRGIVSRA